MEQEELNRYSNGKNTPNFSTPKNKFQGMMPIYPREVLLKTDGENKILSEQESQNLGSLNPNDYGIILNSKYEKSVPTITVNNKSSKIQKEDENSSPLKRWKKHAKSDSQGRVPLMSHVFYS